MPFYSETSRNINFENFKFWKFCSTNPKFDSFRHKQSLENVPKTSKNAMNKTIVMPKLYGFDENTAKFTNVQQDIKQDAMQQTDYNMTTTSFYDRKQ